MSTKDFALGKHLTAEYYDCNPAVLADAKRMEEIFIEAAKRSGATILGSNFHDFEPQGVSGFVVIAESHFSVHAWPEHDYAAVDIFTCGENIDFDAAVNTLRDLMESESVIISSVMNRGVIGNNGIERMVPIYADRTNAYAMAWKTRFDSLNAWGILSSIDLRDIAPEVINNNDALEQALRNFCSDMELDTPDGIHVVPFDDTEKGDGITFCVALANGSLVSGTVAREKQSIYLDILSTEFVEPRIAAEKALSAFNGRHYRMQVAVRR